MCFSRQDHKRCRAKVCQRLNLISEVFKFSGHTNIFNLIYSRN